MEMAQNSTTELSEVHTLRYLLFSNKIPVNILKQYFVNLRVEFDSISAKNEGLPKTVVDKIEEAFEEPLSWFNAYKIEQYLAHICDEEKLEIYLKRYLDNYRDHLSESGYHHYRNELREIESGEADIEEKRSVVLRMQSELHTFYVRRSECRDYGLLTRTRITAVSFVGIILIILSLIYCCYFDDVPAWAKMIPIVFASGFLGTSFSMIVGLKSILANATIEEFKIMHRCTYIIKRLLIGVSAAFVLYFLLQSGFLDHVVSDDLLPKRNGVLEWDSYKNISMLMIWSFIAGFSEKLVPDMLFKVENRMSGNNSLSSRS